MANKSERLAINGGKKTVTLQSPKWPIIGDEEISEVVRIMKESPLSIGDRSGVIAEFEDAFANYHGSRYALSFNSGTASLHSSYYAVGVGPGDEVITPSLTWLTTITTIIHANGIPVFGDIKPGTQALDANDVKRKLTPQTKAIVVVHLWGIPAEMDEIMQVARKYKIPVIEDCSHAHGATYKGRKVGTIGDIGCFSLNAAKSMIAGEGGVLITNNQEYYERAMFVGHHPSRLKQCIQIQELRRYTDAGLGWKYRMPPISAGIAKVQLKKLDNFNAIRRKNDEYFLNNIMDIECLEFIKIPSYMVRGYYGTPIIYHKEKLKGLPREKFVSALNAEGCRVGGAYESWYPLPLFQDRYFYDKGCPWSCPHAKRDIVYRKGDLPVTDVIDGMLIVVPNFAESCFEYLDQVVEAFHKVVKNADQII